MNAEDILQRCLDDVAAGRRTPAECAALFPLVPGLLAQLTAAEALRTWPPATLSRGAALRHQAQLRAALAVTTRRARRPGLALFPRWALAAALVAVLVLGGAGTSLAAAGSLPGQSLYPVKRGTEALQGVFVTAADQAAWHTTLAEARTVELIALFEQGGDIALIEQLAGDITTETDAALANVSAADASQQAALLERLLALLERQQAVLMQVRAAAPPQAQAGLDRAVNASRTHREDALAHLEQVRQRPDDQLPPGQARRTATAAAQGPTDLPPGQARRTATAAAQGPTDLPPGQAHRTATAAAQGPTDLPPGQANKTATAQSVVATPTPPGNSGGQGPSGGPNCSASNPNSSNYCTPTPGSPEGNDNGSNNGGETNSPPTGDAPPTPCPLNPAGKPVCGNRP